MIDILNKILVYLSIITVITGCHTLEHKSIFFVNNDIKTKIIPKKVILEANYDSELLVITTQDEGAGFKPEDIADPLAVENILKTSGRGVFLMGEYADSVEYQDDGRKLILEFILKADT